MLCVNRCKLLKVIVTPDISEVIYLLWQGHVKMKVLVLLLVDLDGSFPSAVSVIDSLCSSKTFASPFFGSYVQSSILILIKKALKIYI